MKRNYNKAESVRNHKLFCGINHKFIIRPYQLSTFNVLQKKTMHIIAKLTLETDLYYHESSHEFFFHKFFSERICKTVKTFEVSKQFRKYFTILQACVTYKHIFVSVDVSSCVCCIWHITLKMYDIFFQALLHKCNHLNKRI